MTPSPQALDASMNEADPSREVISATLKRDKIGSPGFALAGGHANEAFFISYITPGGAAYSDGKLQVISIPVFTFSLNMFSTRRGR